MLDEVFDLQAFAQYAYYEDHSQETFHMITDNALWNLQC